jgi:hypothetical protein
MVISPFTVWVVILSGHIWSPVIDGHRDANFNGGHRDFSDPRNPERAHALCIKTAAEVGGKCVEVPEEPSVGSPDRRAWQKLWCAGNALYSQACDTSLATLWPDYGIRGRWAVIVDGKVSTAHPQKADGEFYFVSPADCANAAHAVRGSCAQIPPVPEIGTPERKAWQAKWCVVGIPKTASEACDRVTKEPSE